MSPIGKPNHWNIITPAAAAVELAAYLTADHVSACAPAVVRVALFRTWNGAYEYVAVPAVLKIISFGFSITNFAEVEGVTVQAAYIVNTGVVPEV